MQRLEVSGAVRLIYRSLGVKGLKAHLHLSCPYPCTGDTSLRNNPTNALIYINVTLFTSTQVFLGFPVPKSKC